VFLGTFPCIHITYPSLVHPLHYSPTSPTLLKMTSTGFNVPCSYTHRKCAIFTILHPPHLPSLSYWCRFIPALHCFSVCSSFSGVLPWHFTCKYVDLNSLTPLLLFLTLPPPHIAQVFSVLRVLLLHRRDVFQYYSLSFYSLFPPPQISSKSPTIGNIRERQVMIMLVFVFRTIFHI
jgi:hypothetical protein